MFIVQFIIHYKPEHLPLSAGAFSAATSAQMCFQRSLCQGYALGQTRQWTHRSCIIARKIIDYLLIIINFNSTNNHTVDQQEHDSNLSSLIQQRQWKFAFSHHNLLTREYSRLAQIWERFQAEVEFCGCFCSFEKIKSLFRN